jgi:hypothetical protein
MNKKGLQLSINFIVIIILALVVFMMGIYLFTQIFSQGKEFTDLVTQDTERRMQQLLIRGDELVIIPDFSQEIKKGDSHQFVMGIKADISKCYENPLNVVPSEVFIVKTTFDMAVDDSNIPIPLTFEDKRDISQWVFASREYEIRNNEQKIIGIPVRMGRNALNGATYVFNVEVLCSNGNLYGDVQKVYGIA